MRIKFWGYILEIVKGLHNFLKSFNHKYYDKEVCLQKSLIYQETLIELSNLMQSMSCKTLSLRS